MLHLHTLSAVANAGAAPTRPDPGTSHLSSPHVPTYPPILNNPSPPLQTLLYRLGYVERADWGVQAVPVTRNWLLPPSLPAATAGAAAAAGLSAAAAAVRAWAPPPRQVVHVCVLGAPGVGKADLVRALSGLDQAHSLRSGKGSKGKDGEGEGSGGGWADWTLTGSSLTAAWGWTGDHYTPRLNWTGLDWTGTHN